MYNTSQLYELSFVAPNRKPRTKPRIVFSINEGHLPEIIDRLHAISQKWETYAAAYCDADVLFTLPNPDLFGRIEFGYGSCGFVVTGGGRAHFGIELSRDKVYCCALSMKLLTMALAVPMDERLSNQLQQADLSLRCDRFESKGYGHGVSGYVSTRITQWLLRQTGDDTAVPVPAEIVSAMRSTWSAVAPFGSERWARECRGSIQRDGRFILDCFGDACDLALYPESVFGDIRDEPFVEIGCHNLDTAEQQLTLLAGFAKLCEIARRDEER